MPISLLLLCSNLQRPFESSIAESQSLILHSEFCILNFCRHCEERSDVAISLALLKPAATVRVHYDGIFFLNPISKLNY